MLPTRVEQIEQPFNETNIASKTMPQYFEADTLGENNHDTLGHNNNFDDDDDNDQFHRMQRVLRTA